MNILYRLFFTTFSMSCMLVILLPMVLILRVAFGKLPRKFTMALWSLFYLRAVCPIGLTSPICLLGNGNRNFHLLLRSIGLTMTPDTGLMTSWRQVYESEISVTVPYMVCTIFWIVGFIGILGFVGWKQRNVEKELKDANLLFDRVYQSDKVRTPVRTGIFRRKIYLPDQLTARETKNILFHEQMHGKRKDDWIRLIFLLISCIHWWNPFIWLAWYLSGVDAETACDEAVVQKLGWDQKEIYAQDIMNMKTEGKGVPLPFVLFGETRLERRAEHMIYLEKTNMGKKGFAAFLLTVCFFGWFGLSALYNTWNGGTWETKEAQQEDTFFKEVQKKTITNEILVKCETKNPKEEIIDLELIMTQGTYQEGEGYTGQCMLRMKDTQGETIDTLLLSEIFQGDRQQQFDENITLCVEDYNEDGILELSLGQELEVTREELSVPASESAVDAELHNEESSALSKEENVDSDREKTEKIPVQMYYLINLEEDAFRVVSEPVYVSEVTLLQKGSMAFSYVPGAKGVITTVIGEEMACYVWDEEGKMYSRQNITQEEIDRRKEPEGEEMEAGEKNRHFLENGSQAVMAEVKTKTDATGKEWIKKLKIYPWSAGEKGKSFKDIEGYYRSLDWVTVADEEVEAFRYAVLGYGDDKGQGFIFYDIKEQKELYRQDKDYHILQEILKDFDDSEITFTEESAAVYSIMEMQDANHITIGFAADAGDGIIITGRYHCDIATGETSDLSYTRELEE